MWLSSSVAPNVFHISSEPSLIPNSCSSAGLVGRERSDCSGGEEKRKGTAGGDRQHSGAFWGRRAYAGREGDERRQAKRGGEKARGRVRERKREVSSWPLKGEGGVECEAGGNMGSEKSGAGGGGGEQGAGPTARGSDDGQHCCGCRFPLLLALLQLLLGIAIAAVAFLMAAISSSLLARETPHWAGIILCIVSVLGFILYAITYLPDENTFMQFVVKVLYFLLCSVGLVISILVIAFQGHHYSLTNGFTCRETGQDCVCTLEPEDPIGRTFTYTGVTDCTTITSTLMQYYLLQMVLNLVQAFVCLLGAFIMWKHRYQVLFAGLQMGSPSTQHWQKV